MISQSASQDSPAPKLYMDWAMASSLVNRVRWLFDVFFSATDRYCPDGMLRITAAFLAAVRSLARSTSIIQRILTSWYIRIIRESHKDFRQPGKSLDVFAEDVEQLLGQILDPHKLLRLSVGLQRQFQKALRSDARCMLPSYNHQLPHGKERGTYLALDVGGSTFRVALVELFGSMENGTGVKLDALKSYKINDAIKQLKGEDFFNWMAGKIEETISGHPNAKGGALSMGLAWSFPIEQTSLRSGLMQGMGKGFLAAEGLLGSDLGDLIQEACSRRDLNVHLKAIVNDSSATLLSSAYSDPSTRYALILGTGVNIAVHLPVGAFPMEKLGVRPSSWHDAAKHVIVNTELGMFGKGLLPMTQWDTHLNATHIRPDFQPFEHLVSGRYLGEIVRLILLDGIRDANLLGGEVPSSLEQPYSMDTALLAYIQDSTTFREARDIFSTSHPTKKLPTESDIRSIRIITSAVTERACAILAAAIHGLWQLRNDAEDGEAHLKDHTVMACNGSVVQNYPGFQKTCQNYLNALVEMSGGSVGSLVLTSTMESSLLGAAVAVACLDDEKVGI